MGGNLDGDKEIVDLAAKLIAAILTKKVVAVIAILFLLGAGGTSVFGNALGALLVPAPQVEVTSPQMERVVERNIAPVQAMITDHAEQFAHPSAIRKLADIDEHLERQEKQQEKIVETVAKTSEDLNRLVGQVEILVQYQLGGPR